MDNTTRLNLRHVNVLFKNFEGRKVTANGRVLNQEGCRNFAVHMDPEMAQALMDDGWSIKAGKVHNEDDEPWYYMPVSLRFDNFPPRVYLVTKTGKVLLDTDTIGELDSVDIAYADITIRPYCWEVNGKSGVKAYVKTMYAVLDENEFDSEYADR